MRRSTRTRSRSPPRRQLHDVSYKNALHRAANVDWWLDVEILNSWQTLDDHPAPGAAERDTMTLVGAVRALWTVGVERVGIYSTRYQWNLITGGPAVTHDWFAKSGVARRHGRARTRATGLRAIGASRAVPSC